MKKGPWEVQQTNRIFKDRFIELNSDKVIGPHNTETTYSTVNLKPGVAVLAIDTNNQVFLTKQYRYSINKESIEVVCGGIDGNVRPLAAAQSELQEEIGIRARDWIDLGTIDMDSSVVHCPLHMFVARQLSKVATEPDRTEEISYFVVSFDEALHLVMTSVITQAVSIVLILKAYNRFGRRDTL
jgi:8-oxo-dGTP pyrophosphatase MutT (NUDIX family)